MTIASRITAGSIVFAIAAIAAFVIMMRVANPDIPRFTGSIEPFGTADELVEFLQDNRGNGVYLDVDFQEGEYLDMSKLTSGKPSDPATLSFYGGCERPASGTNVSGICTHYFIDVTSNPEVAQHVDRISLVSGNFKGYFLVADYNSVMSAVGIDLRPVSARGAAEGGGINSDAGLDRLRKAIGIG